MINETIDLIFRFISQGQADIERMSGQFDKVTQSAQRASAEVDKVSTSAAKVSQAATGIERAMSAALAVTAVSTFGVALVGVVEIVGDLYNQWNSVNRAQKEALDLVQSLSKEFGRLDREQTRLLERRILTREGRSGLLRYQAGEAEAEARYFNQGEIDRARQQIEAAERRIRNGTGQDGLTQDAKAATATLVGLNAQLEKAVLQQKISLATAKEFREEADKLDREESKRNLERVVRAKAEIERIITGYQDKGVNGSIKFNDQLLQAVDRIRRTGGGQDAVLKLLTAASGEGSLLLNQDLTRLQVGERIKNRSFIPYFFENAREPIVNLPGAIDLARPNFGYDFIASPIGNGRKVGSDGEFNGEAVESEEQLEALVKGRLESVKRIHDLAKLTANTEVSAAARLLELTGNEYEAAKLIHDLKISQAETTLETRQAELEYSVKVAEIEKQRLDRYKEGAGRVFDALKSNGRGGISSLITGQFDVIERQLFMNVSGRIFQSGGGALGKLGEASGLPKWFLDGTLFDPKNGQKPLDKNTLSMDELRRSIDNLRKQLAGGVMGAGGVGTSLYDLPLGSPIGRPSDWTNLLGSDLNGITGSKVFGKIFGTSGKQSTNDFIAGLATLASGKTFSTIFSSGRKIAGYDEMGNPQYVSGTSGAERAGAIVGSAGALAAGGFGIYSGIREGGGRGATTAIGSALGIAAMIPGPQQPFVIAAATIAGLVRGFLGDPKAEFDKRQTALLESRRYVGPEAINKTFDYATGREIDYDWRSRVRTMAPTIQVNVSVDTMDAKSFIDNKDKIMEAVGRGVAAGHPANQQFLKLFGRDS